MKYVKFDEYISINYICVSLPKNDKDDVCFQFQSPQFNIQY